VTDVWQVRQISASGSFASHLFPATNLGSKGRRSRHIDPIQLVAPFWLLDCFNLVIMATIAFIGSGNSFTLSNEMSRNALQD
jgi:hypothetical protein